MVVFGCSLSLGLLGKLELLRYTEVRPNVNTFTKKSLSHRPGIQLIVWLHRNVTAPFVAEML